jgi:hypothetical protein
MSKRWVDTGDMFLIKGWGYIQKEEEYWTLRREAYFQHFVNYKIELMKDYCWARCLKIYEPRTEKMYGYSYVKNRTFFDDNVYYDFQSNNPEESVCLTHKCFNALIKFFERHQIPRIE